MYQFDIEAQIAGSIVGLLGTIGDNGAVNVTEVRIPGFVDAVGWVAAEYPLSPAGTAAYLAAHRLEIDAAVRDHAQAEGEARSEARGSR